MQDPVLDRQLAETRELQELWQLFLDYFKIGVKGGESINPDNEAKFLEVKSHLAMLHDVFLSALRKQEQRQTGQNVMTIVGRCVTLKHINRLSDVDIKKMNLEWHECYLLLNETIADLEEKVARLAAISPASFYFNRWRRRIVAAVTNFFKSAGFKLAIIVGALAAFLVAWNALDLGGQMKKVAALRPVYYAGEDFYRTFINKNHPFDSVDRLLAYRRRLPEGWTEEGQASETRQVLENRIRGSFGAEAGELISKATDYRGMRMRYDARGGPGGGIMDVHVWVLPSSYQGQQFLDIFRKWKIESNQNVVAQVEGRIRFLRWLNGIVIFSEGSNIMRDRAAQEIYAGAQRP